MNLKIPFLAAVMAAIPLVAVAQQAKSPAKAKRGEIRLPDESQKKQIEDRLARLKSAISELKSAGIEDSILVEIEVYAKAADWIGRHNEYFDDQAQQTIAVLDQGIERARSAKEAPWRKILGKSVVRAYRSRVDGSLQPYAVTFPSNFDKETANRWRLDVVLHGRDGVLTEVKFLNSYKAKSAPKDMECVRIDIFGRTNNAYRWAGETDVFEAMDSFIASEKRSGRAVFLDARRVVLHGFSMGGAGSWHLGLHYPCRWAAIGPGAGFTTTKGYTSLPEPLPPYIDRCLTIYDAVNYAENSAMVPVIAYAGENDKQLQAARNIEAKLKPLNIPMTLFIAPNTEHKLIPEYEKKMEAEYQKAAGPGRGRNPYPAQIRFVTHTLKFSKCDWIELWGLDRHYDRASVEAGFRSTPSSIEYDLKTRNVSRIQIRLPQGADQEILVSIDGSNLKAKSSGVKQIQLEKTDGQWQVVAEYKGLRKVPGLQGPIDDAFADSFICVKGTGTPWNPQVNDLAVRSLDRFQREWDKFMRGELKVKNDKDLTEEDIHSKNLILFGDPGSNSLIAKTLAGIKPLVWDKSRISIGGVGADSPSAMPVLVYPNPLNSTKYVVLNSGHTFHADAFIGTNALLYPRLGDFAILKAAPTAKDPLACEVINAGIFDEFWQSVNQ